MARSKRRSVRLTKSTDRRDAYTSEDLAEIERAVGALDGTAVPWTSLGDSQSIEMPRSEALRKALILTASVWSIHRDRQEAPRPAAIRKKLETVARGAEKLLLAVGWNDRGVVLRHVILSLSRSRNAALGISMDEAMARAMLPEPDPVEVLLAGVDELRRCAISGAEEPQSGRSEPAHAGNLAAKRMAFELCFIWHFVLGRSVSRSRKSPATGGQRPAGPLLRFMKAAMAPLLRDELPKDETLYAYIGEAKALLNRMSVSR